jgi:hypothetical protein
MTVNTRVDASQASVDTMEASVTTPVLGTLVLKSSRRLSVGMALHIFSAPCECLESLPVSGHMRLELPENLDPMTGAQKTSHSHRLVTFTPCHIRETDTEGLKTISVLARHGRISQLLGLPRLNAPLTANIIGVGGGFPADALACTGRRVCVASGAGLAPFLSLACTDDRTRNSPLICTINGSDFDAIEHLIASKILAAENWLSVVIFLTPGVEMSGLIAGKTSQWWKEKLATLQASLTGFVRFECRRIVKDDLMSYIVDSKDKVLFCGSKSLEWQVKMWMLNEMPVYTTMVE